MPRPRKFRRVCALPENKTFGPINNASITSRNIIMSIEEYEAIRLIDYEGFTQEECVERMDVSRTTVQRIYNEARIKIAASLVEGTSLLIDGGNYVLCENRDVDCGTGRCNMYGRHGNGQGHRRGRGFKNNT